MKNPEELRDWIVVNIFQDTQNNLPIVKNEENKLGLTVDFVDQILIEQLIKVKSPFKYLINCYQRANEIGGKIRLMKDKDLEFVVKQSKNMIVSYCIILLGNPTNLVFSSEVEESKICLLLPFIFWEVSTPINGQSREGLQAPTGFLEDLFRYEDYTSLEPIMRQLYNDLRDSVVKVSAIGDFHTPLNALSWLITYPAGAKALVNHPRWIPDWDFVTGRVMEMDSILGPFFHGILLLGELWKWIAFWVLSFMLVHYLIMMLSRVNQTLGVCLLLSNECFPYTSGVRRADNIISTYTTIRTVTSYLLQDGLEKVLLSLLKNTSTLKNVLEYLSEVINKNDSRAHIEVDPLSCASSGMFINLSAVMLRLCGPFLDAHLTKRNKIDPNYVVDNSHLDFRGLTALHASSEEVSEWRSINYLGPADASRTKSNGDDPLLLSQDARSIGWGPSLHPSCKTGLSCTNKAEYSFVCECFFMTARVLHLGLLKALSHFKKTNQDTDYLRVTEELLNMKDVYAQDPSPESQEAIVRIEGEISLLYREQLCFSALILKDEGLFQHALSFYRLMVVWLLDLVGGTKIPLPSSCPMEFAAIPEHFVEDTMDLLIYSATLVPKALDVVFLDDFMNFIVIFMASPQCIRNPYLRVKMVKVLLVWIPSKSVTPATVAPFERNQLALEHLVRNLLKLYVDVEFTGSHSQFYDKLESRHYIVTLLKYLWKVPSHCNALKQVAKEDVKGVFFNFLNLLINDCIHLLDESMNNIIELKELEDEISNKAKWEEKPSEERLERARQFQSHEKIIRFDMQLAKEVLLILAFTLEQIKAPFLLNDMVERIASMLNYFLLRLVGPQRKSLRLKDHAKYGFHPKQLLKQIVGIYVYLARGDEENVFPTAIIKDERSYNDKLFKDAAVFLSKIGEDASVIQELLDLDAKARVASSEATKAEEALGNIPEDFLDPIQCTLMRDPVILPVSRTTVDRDVIQRHLLSAKTDPFSRSPLTAEMLIPNTDLKSKIEEFIRSRKL